MRTPFAVLGIRTAGGAVTGIEYLPRPKRAQAPADAIAERAVRSSSAISPIRSSASRCRWRRGTPFRRRVWEALRAIPVGESRTYGELARAAAHGAARRRRRLRRQSDRAGHPVPSRRRQPGLARRLHGTRPTATRSRSSAGCLRTKATVSAPDGARPKPPMARLAATELIDAFCDQVWLQDGLAASSLASYRRDLTQWAAWLDSARQALLAAQRADVEAFLADQFRAKAKATSIARRLSSLRRFYALQLQQGTLRADPTLRVRAPKLPRRLPKNLTEAQVEALLAAPDTETTLGLRDRAMLETLYATGLARVRARRPQARAGVARHGRRARARQGQQGAARAARRGGDRLAQALSRRRRARRSSATARATRCSSPRAAAPLTRQAFWALVKRYAVEGRHPGGQPVAARAAPRVRDASPQPRRRPARRAAAARPRRHHDDDDLHARRARAAEAAPRAASSARLTRATAMAKDRPPVTAAVRVLREHGVAFTDHPYEYEERGGTAGVGARARRARARGDQDADAWRTTRSEPLVVLDARRPRGLDEGRWRASSA